MSEKILNTKFEYMYRDAANYKDDYSIVLDGVLSDDQIIAVLDACDNEFFLPRAIGLPGGLLMDDPKYDPEFDHYWCEHDFEDSFIVVEEEPTKINARGTQTTISADEFVALFERCKDHSWESILADPICVLDIRAEREDSEKNMGGTGLSESAQSVYKMFKDEYIEHGYMYSGSLPRNSSDLANVEKVILDELVNVGILQVRDCEGYAFELSVKERGGLMNKLSLASKWYEEAGNALLADIQEEVKNASFVSRCEEGVLSVHVLKHADDVDKPDVVETKSPFVVGQILDIEFDLRHVDQATGYAERRHGPCGKETGEFMVSDIVSNLLVYPPINMIELQSLSDKFNKLYPDERTMLLFEDVVLKRLKDRVPSLDQIIDKAAGEVKTGIQKDMEFTHERY